ncbi:MAG: hypothetical protein LAP87_25445 [Acidobacteriia bacterium]|nr:hypothetical protein [Terriglobia bacterium]
MRPQTSSRLTLEEHRDLGIEIRTAHARLRELCNLVLTVYGPNNQAAFTFLKVTEDLDRLSQDLQSQAAEDLPGFPVTGFYL